MGVEHIAGAVLGLGLSALGCGQSDDRSIPGTSAGWTGGGAADTTGTGTWDHDVDPGTTGGSTEEGSTAPPTDDGPATAEHGEQPCNPPDLLLVLDRTMSMHRRPDASVPPNTVAGRQESKWFVAIAAIEAFTTELDDVVRFGLELFPSEPADTSCVLLQERIAGIVATNPSCQEGELAVLPDLHNAAPIGDLLDHEATRLCDTTPIGRAVATASPILAGIADDDRDQAVVLLTDGAETCSSHPVAEIQDLSATGVDVYVIGFGDSALTQAHSRLNRMACAGRTATGFPGPCSEDADGHFDAADPNGPAVYLAAEDGAALEDALAIIASLACCGSGCEP